MLSRKRAALKFPYAAGLKAAPELQVEHAKTGPGK
jgi:hypothetical protein